MTIAIACTCEACEIDSMMIRFIDKLRIRKLKKDGFEINELAIMFDTSEHVIRGVINGR